MAKKPSKKKKQIPPEEPQKTETTSEPEGGPLGRAKEFLEERLSKLRPKGEGPVEESAPAGTPFTPEAPEEESQAAPDAAEERKRALEEFRERRRKKSPENHSFDSPGAMPPETPVPPPANNWIPIGPSVLRQGQGGATFATSGRTPAIDVVTGGTRIYVGAANGGVWRSDDTGQTWRSLMESFDLNPMTAASDSLSVGAVAVDPTDPDIVYVGSGEGAGAAYFGVGPIVTNNGTASAPSWTTELAAPGSSSLAGTAFYALVVDPTNPGRVVAATYRGVYRREPTGAGGFHWVQKTMGGATSQRVTSVVGAISGGGITFYATRQGGPVYSSTDGHTWTAFGSSFPITNVGRVGLAVQPGNPNIVYALVARSDNYHLLGVYRLDTADGTWRQVSGVPSTLFGPAGTTFGQGWYDVAIAVAPDNVNRIYLGGSTALSGGDWAGSLYRCEISISGTSVSATPTYIGNSVHADIHTIVFAPGDANKMWVGCDGGVFYSTNPTGSGDIFTAKNTGLQTLTMEYLGQHPSEDAILFAGTQDNGGERFTGEEAWLLSAGGDGGFAIVNWNDPYKVLSTYVYGGVRRSTNGGARYSYSNVNVPLVTVPSSEPALFYAPIAGTPPNPGSPTAAADSDLVAFGSIRPWISTTFGGGWQSIPNNTLAGDSLDGRIKSLAFASEVRLYAGTMNGGVYRFDRAGAAWTRTQIDTMGGANQLPLAGIVTDIAVDPTNDSHVYITFGGTGDWRHVWYFDGTQWQQRSGPADGSVDSLLDVQTSAIVVDPDHPTHLYIGTDIGVWRSTDSGATWDPYSEGLPDAAVMDLLLHNPRRLLRAATHGRCVWERTLPDISKAGVELYVRDTQLDQGRFPTVDWLPDPTAIGELVRHWAGPDIKLDTPNAMGEYQFPLTENIDFHQFVDILSDDAQNVATHATATITTRVYVQVHNRGVLPADNVQVMLLLANASAGLPALPAGYWTNVQTGVPITTTSWRTLGFVTLNDVRVGMPKIAAFDLTSDMLPPPANLAGNQHHCVLALIHHASDPYNSTITNTDDNSVAERKAAHKNLTVVQFTGVLPAPPVFIPLRIHNAELEREITANVILNLRGYPGHGRLYIPPLTTVNPLNEAVRGMKIDQDNEPFKKWSDEHVHNIRLNLESEKHYDKEWSLQRIEEIQRAMENGTMFTIDKGTKTAELHGLRMKPDSYHTFFLALDRPEEGQIGQSYLVDILQSNAEQQKVTGGLTLRVELVKEPVLKVYRLELWQQKWLFGYHVLRARLYDPDGQMLASKDDAAVWLHMMESNRWLEVQMRWHQGWQSFYYFARNLAVSQVVATGMHHGIKVAEVQLSTPETEAFAGMAAQEHEASS